MAGSSFKCSFEGALVPSIIVAIVGMMVFPLPAAILDFLLVLNIAFALLLLIRTVYLAQPEKFTSLPAILLLSTLFRLSLNISTTRQILSGGDVPHLVVTFGNFVVRGNMAVGFVVFAIITLVQFLVIAKGAERVAEVAARFTLDAMPGKQMSIDADIRSGILSLSQAKQKRSDLALESKLYGALDGAMKFVKGDAIAGLLITLINIIGGLAIGVMQQKLGFAEAASRFSLFSIGDGLASQIPALLITVAAGIAVTRVGDSDARFLGSDLIRQVFSEPQALGVTSLVLFLLAFVPGFPLLLLLVLAALTALLASKESSKQRKMQTAARQTAFRPAVCSGLLLRLTVKAAARLHEEASLPHSVQLLRQAVFRRWGVFVPDVQLELEQNQSDPVASLYFNGMKVFDFSESAIDRNEKFSKLVLERLEHFLCKNLLELIDDTHTRQLLDIHQASAEDLINSLIPDAVSTTTLTTILRELLADGVNICSLTAILQSLAEYKLTGDQKNAASALERGGVNLTPSLRALAAGNMPQTELDELLCAARIGLRRTIIEQVLGADGRVHAWLLDPEIDLIFAKASYASVPIEPAVTEEVLKEIARIVNEAGEDKRAVLISSRYSRRRLSAEIRQQYGNVVVIAANELPCDVELEVKGEVKLFGAAAGRDAEAAVAEKEEAFAPRLVGRLAA